MKNLKRMESAFMSEFEKVTTGLGEECGVFGAYDMDGGDVAPSVYYGLFALQHRGQESCGIAVTDTYGERKVQSLTLKAYTSIKGNMVRVDSKLLRNLMRGIIIAPL